MKLTEWLTGKAGSKVPAFSNRENAKAPSPELKEYGTTGSSVFGGYLRDLGEYNPTLEGFSAFAVYEKMRRSDAQVAATLSGMKLPIRTAEWAVVAPAHPTPIEQEATDFVRTCLFEAIDFDQVLENALLMLDFGCSAHEDVWTVDGNRVRLAKCAPRHPATFNRWIFDESENLRAIEQRGWKAGGYTTVEVSSEKLAVFSSNSEGGNIAGRSVMRPMYQHWYMKNNLYKIDAVSIERNGMGVPYVVMGPDSKAEDRRAAINWMQQLCAHEKAAIVFPHGWEFGIKGVEGKVLDPYDSIAHHNVEISMAGLAEFMMLGSSGGGNRALGATMADSFYRSLQGTARRIAQTISLSTVRRLVEFNFGAIRSPQLIHAEIRGVLFADLMKALQSLASARLIHPDEGIERWLRKAMGAPEVKRTSGRAVRTDAEGLPAPMDGEKAKEGPVVSPRLARYLKSRSGRGTTLAGLSAPGGKSMRLSFSLPAGMFRPSTGSVGRRRHGFADEVKE